MWTSWFVPPWVDNNLGVAKAGRRTPKVVNGYGTNKIGSGTQSELTSRSVQHGIAHGSLPKYPGAFPNSGPSFPELFYSKEGYWGLSKRGRGK